MIINKSISFDEILWKEIDKLRGDVSRSKFISKCLMEYFKQIKKDNEYIKTDVAGSRKKRPITI